MASLNERLQNGEILLLDGGVSTEIRRRGVTLDKNVWSGLATKTHQFTCNKAARKWNDFYWQGKGPENANLFTLVSDANKFSAGCCDDFLAGQGSTSALDQAPVGVKLIGAINIYIQATGLIQVYHPDTAGL